MHSDIRDLPLAERPRERLAGSGPACLSDRELVALVLGAGAPGHPVLDLSARLLDLIGGRGGLAAAASEDLERLPGLGPSRAARLVAAVELGRRSLVQLPRGAAIRGPGDLRDVVLSHLGGEPREILGLCLLDARMRLIGFRRVSEGTVFSTPASARAVFAVVLATSAAAVILVHNHPSGDPTPSPEDIEATSRLVAAGASLEVPVLDHLILGGDRLVSLKEAGYMT